MTKSLEDATVQEIHLELIRRRAFNEFNGKKIHASLLQHRDLWQAVLLDRQGLADLEKPDQLYAMSLIKLRDLPGNRWNADTLFILTKSDANARELAEIAHKEDWRADEIQVQDDHDEVARALGVYGISYGLVTMWWD